MSTASARPAALPRILGLAAALALLSLLAACDKKSAPPAPAAAAPGSTAAAAKPATDGYQVVLEAADAKGLDPARAWKVTVDPTASKGKCISAALGEGKTDATAGTLTLTAQLPVAARAQVWVRALWKGSCSNSLILDLKLPGVPEQILGKDGTYDKWHWIRGPVVALPAGAYTFAINQRQDDVRFDQVLLSTDLKYIPVDLE